MKVNVFEVSIRRLPDLARLRNDERISAPIRDRFQKHTRRWREGGRIRLSGKGGDTSSVRVGEELINVLEIECRLILRIWSRSRTDTVRSAAATAENRPDYNLGGQSK